MTAIGAGHDPDTDPGKLHHSGGFAFGPAIEPAFRHVVAAGVGDRGEAVRVLAAYPQRWELTHDDVTTILERYPAMMWDSQTSACYLRLVGEITPGGLPMVLATVPDQTWVAAEAKMAVATSADIEPKPDTAAPPGHHRFGDRATVEDQTARALLLLIAQGVITGRDPSTEVVNLRPDLAGTMLELGPPLWHALPCGRRLRLRVESVEPEQAGTGAWVWVVGWRHDPDIDAEPWRDRALVRVDALPPPAPTEPDHAARSASDRADWP